MGSGAGDFLKDTWEDTKDIAEEAFTAKKLRHEIKEGWDDVRGATEQRKQKREAERIAKIPGAEKVGGMESQMQDAKRRRGRSSTRLTRSPLGGGASIT